MKFRELTSTLLEHLSKFKSLTRTIENIVNSSQTPEEFLLTRQLAPSLAKIKHFLHTYDLRQVINLQMFNSSNQLFYHANKTGFCLKIHYSDIPQDYLRVLMKYNYPKNTTMSILLDMVHEKALYITIVHAQDKQVQIKKTKSLKLDQIMQMIVNDFHKLNIPVTIMYPSNMLYCINLILYGSPILHNSPMFTEYNPEQYLYEQLEASTNNDIDKSAKLFINDHTIQIYYTKQYPNINKSIANPINHLISSMPALKFYYAININLDQQTYHDESVYQFTSIIGLVDEEFDLTKYFRREYEWFIYPNLLYPLQQFIDIIPFQFDSDTANRQARYSTTQYFPENKLVELISVGGKV